MKQFLLFIISVLSLCSCSTPEEQTNLSIEDYLQSNLRNPKSYQSGAYYFWEDAGMPDTAFVSKHIYSVVNSSGDRVERNITFYLNADNQVIGTDPVSVNGDYGSVSGNVYWKFNDYVGNRPDAGAKIFLYPVDSIADVDNVIEVQANLSGDYAIEDLLPGRYFCIIKSGNVKDCPIFHYIKFSVYKETLNELFGIDFSVHEDEMQEIDSLQKSLFSVTDKSIESFGSVRYSEMRNIKNNLDEKISDFISSMPIQDLKKIKIIYSYGEAVEFKWIEIKERKKETIVTDFEEKCK